MISNEMTFRFGFFPAKSQDRGEADASEEQDELSSSGLQPPREHKIPRRADVAAQVDEAVLNGREITILKGRVTEADDPAVLMDQEAEVSPGSSSTHDDDYLLLFPPP